MPHQLHIFHIRISFLDTNSIQDAIDNVSEGDTVYVYSGTYFESVTIDKPLTLTGENKINTIIDSESQYYAIFVSGENITINNLSITTGIRDLSNYSLEEGEIIPQYCGVWFFIYTRNCVVNNCIVYDCETSGIKISGKNITILNTICTGNSNGIGIEADNNTIMDNNCSHNRGSGVIISADNNIIRNNIIFSNNGTGISIHDIGPASIDGEIIYEISENNVLYHNVFKNNIKNADGNGNNIWYNANLEGGNYWDDYNGTDADGDGIGDIPYNISGGSQDLYPLGYFVQEQDEDSGSPGFELLLIIISVILVLFWRRKK